MDEDPKAKNRRFWNAWSPDYQARHGDALARRALAWGVWGIPEAEVGALGDVAGRDVLELGCGAAQFGVALAERGARVVGLDFSDRQLAHARRHVARAGVALPLVQADAERTPFADARFDLVFCDHGATSFARPEPAVAEAARLLRPGGRFVFNIASPLHDVCWDLPSDTLTRELRLDYFELDRLEDERQVSFHRPYGAWIRLFRSQGLDVLDLIELRAPADGQTPYTDFVPHDWARRWPAENIWVLERSRRELTP